MLEKVGAGESVPFPLKTCSRVHQGKWSGLTAVGIRAELGTETQDGLMKPENCQRSQMWGLCLV